MRKDQSTKAVRADGAATKADGAEAAGSTKAAGADVVVVVASAA